MRSAVAATRFLFAPGDKHAGQNNWRSLAEALQAEAAAKLAAGSFSSIKTKHSWQVIAGLPVAKVAERAKAVWLHRKTAEAAAAPDSDSDSE